MAKPAGTPKPFGSGQMSNGIVAGEDRVVPVNRNVKAPSKPTSGTSNTKRGK